MPKDAAPSDEVNVLLDQNVVAPVQAFGYRTRIVGGEKARIFCKEAHARFGLVRAPLAAVPTKPPARSRLAAKVRFGPSVNGEKELGRPLRLRAKSFSDELNFPLGRRFVFVVHS